MGLDTPELVRRALRALVIATVALYVLTLGVAGYAYWQQHQTNQAICTFRADLQQRVDQGEAYLADHPEGVFGLTPAQIRASLDGQRRTIAALAVADC